jgi:hypothetical protein
MLTIIAISLRDANAFVTAHHRHHKPVVGHKFSLAVSDGERIRGVAIVGRPVARMLNDGLTLEVNRVCTDGARNACSMLYAATWREAKRRGIKRLVTYTLPAEGGASLRGAGWKLTGTTKGGSWSRPSRGRTDKHPLEAKWRWEAC